MTASQNQSYRTNSLRILYVLSFNYSLKRNFGIIFRLNGRTFCIPPFLSFILLRADWVKLSKILRHVIVISLVSLLYSKYIHTYIYIYTHTRTHAHTYAFHLFIVLNFGHMGVLVLSKFVQKHIARI